jgi:hypothetical protein
MRVKPINNPVSKMMPHEKKGYMEIVDKILANIELADKNARTV